MGFQVRVQEILPDSTRDHIGDRFNKERGLCFDGWVGKSVRIFILIKGLGLYSPLAGWKLTVEQQTHQQRTHQTPLGIMHVVPIPQPLLCLTAHFTFHPVAPLAWSQLRPKVVNQVLYHVARFRKDQWFVIRYSIRFDLDDRGLPERMYLFEFWWCEHIDALVGLELVWEGELFEEPEDTL